MKIKLFVALSSFANHGTYPLEVLEKNNFSVVFNKTGKRLKPEEIIKMAKDSDCIIAGVEPYNKYVLDSLPNLKCISRAGVGIDNIDLELAKLKNISIRNTPDVIVTPVSELTLSMILSLLRKLNPITNDMRNGGWNKTTGANLNNKKVGIIGAGRIGKRVAELLSCFGAKILIHDPIKDLEWSKKFLFKYVDINDIFSNCDVISLHTSKIDDEYLIGLEEIKSFKKGSILINTSRGNLVDESALIYGMENEILSGIGLDVFPDEPYNGRLINYKNVILTPHVATLTSESRLEMETKASENVVEFFNK